MQTLIWSPGLANLKLLRRNPIAFSFRRRVFSSFSDYSNQARGRLPRFYSDKLPTSKGGLVRVEGHEFWHMTKVLRLNVNDRVELFNGKCGLVEGSIQNIDRTGVDFVAAEKAKLVSPMATQWHVFAAFGTFKGGPVDWLVEKCTELGASSLTLQSVLPSFQKTDLQIRPCYSCCV